jgi:hypothetical protein
MRKISFFAAVVFAVPAFAQKYEVGVHGGGSIYQSRQISNARGSVDAGFGQGWSAGVTIGQDMYEHVSGELRYSYLHNGSRLNAGSADAKFGAQSHAIHYDLLVHTTRREANVRPYVAAGGGAKIYQGTGAEQAFQPLSDIAILTKTTDFQGLLSFGGGVKVKLTESMWFRFDVHDYISPFPKKVITPGVGSSVSGWLNNIVPTAGLTFTF